MGIELKITGMCEYCPVADLDLEVDTYNRDHPGLPVYSVKCKHQQACERQRGMVLNADNLVNSFMFKTCGKCGLFDPSCITNYMRDDMYCVRVGTEVTYNTTACKGFVPRESKKGGKDEEDE